MRRAHILIYAKPPRIGLAKTRLARSLGAPAQAQRIARMSLARTMRAVSSGPWTPILYTAPNSALNETLGGLWPPTLKRRSQGKGDLTARLEKGLNETPPGPVLFIGADAPDISASLINHAVKSLTSHDAVFGPARDGGFWVFGINKTARTNSPFQTVRWSTEYALADVRANLPADSRIAYLSTLMDIDDAQDWHAWRTSRRSVDKR